MKHCTVNLRSEINASWVMTVMLDTKGVLITPWLSPLLTQIFTQVLNTQVLNTAYLYDDNGSHN